MQQIRYNNILRPFPGLNDSQYKYINFVCRCCMSHDHKENWLYFAKSTTLPEDRWWDSSYMVLTYDPDSYCSQLKVCSRGEVVGVLGYVDSEHIEEIKDALEECDAYRIDMVNRNDIGKPEIPLIFTWKPNCFYKFINDY